MAWPAGTSRYQIAPEAAPAVSLATRAAVLDHAFSLWAAADCGGVTHPAIDVARTADPTRSAVRFTDELPPGDGKLALTDLGFDLATGAIRRATMTFYWPQLAAYGDAPPLAAVALHETGHWLGLAHSNDPGAVMAGEVNDASLARLALTADDIAAICAAYPPPALPAASPGAAPIMTRGRYAIGLAALLAGLAIAAGCHRHRYRQRRRNARTTFK